MITIFVSQEDEKINQFIKELMADKRRVGNRKDPANLLSHPNSTLLNVPRPEQVDEVITSLSNFLYSEKKGILYKSVIEKVEKPLIECMLCRTEGNQVKAAKILGINRNTMRSKIKKFAIDLHKLKI